MTELDEIKKKLGGVFHPETNLCLNFGNLTEESNPTLNHVYDFSNHSHLEITGEDRSKFLNNFCSAKIVDLTPGEGTEAFLLNISGHILQHIFVFVTEDSIQIESGANSEDFIFQHLDHYVIMEDVEIHRRTSEWCSLFLTGNEIDSYFESQGIDVSNLQMNSHLEKDLNQIACQIRRVEILNQPGYVVCCPKNDVEPLWNHLVDSNVSPAGEEAWQSLRIESGFPVFGVDITEKNLAQEAARTEQAISFTKGCYLGQETVARIDSVGHVNKQLCRLEIQGDRESLSELTGMSVIDSDNKEIGTLTSLAWSPGKNLIVALGYLKFSYTTSGTEIVLSSGVQGRVL